VHGRSVRLPHDDTDTTGSAQNRQTPLVSTVTQRSDLTSGLISWLTLTHDAVAWRMRGEAHDTVSCEKSAQDTDETRSLWTAHA
jgi:hypothetical protein